MSKTNQNCIHWEIRSRLNSGDACCNWDQKLQPCNITKITHTLQYQDLPVKNNNVYNINISLSYCILQSNDKVYSLSLNTNMSVCIHQNARLRNVFQQFSDIISSSLYKLRNATHSFKLCSTIKCNYNLRVGS